MRLEIASKKAIQYACMNFHYAKAVPANALGFSVFNNENKWCGCILYGSGANANIATPYNLRPGQVVELVRMALNGKQESTSKAMAISLKILPKYLPLVKLVVSYADIDEGHKGTIYQATNWFFEGECEHGAVSSYIIKGKKIHRRSIFSMIGTSSFEEIKKKLDPNAKQFVSLGKRKYIYPIDKSLLPLCKKLAKPYPKKE